MFESTTMNFIRHLEIKPHICCTFYLPLYHALLLGGICCTIVYYALLLYGICCKYLPFSMHFYWVEYVVNIYHTLLPSGICCTILYHALLLYGICCTIVCHVLLLYGILHLCTTHYYYMEYFVKLIATVWNMVYRALLYKTEHPV